MSSKSVVPLQRYCNFWNFWDNCRHHLGFLKLWNFTDSLDPECRNASSFQISSKSVNPLRRYCDFSNFQDSRHCHLRFLKLQTFYGLTGSKRSRLINVLNFVKIGQLVVKILRFFDFSSWQPSTILDLFGANLDHLRRVIVGLCYCAKFGNNHSILEIRKFNIWHEWLDNGYLPPKFGFWGSLPP